ncbi:hypothetical protein P691DRAFT_783146 [Macrolepiota fuliginosa MF-IS2]|uniref:Uncharacterized protein n=1 Tax=Macrolepiota fuliginosa MF-IS2 TaxID=1400762 RepID=A0A9P5XC48_9AGAR|nr:hypothetical protein P691DRAFT_783146 [Macrolepiota fuliginosa MF-IS2]
MTDIFVRGGQIEGEVEMNSYMGSGDERGVEGNWAVCTPSPRRQSTRPSIRGCRVCKAVQQDRRYDLGIGSVELTPKEKVSYVNGDTGHGGNANSITGNGAHGSGGNNKGGANGGNTSDGGVSGGTATTSSAVRAWT